jgi:hypothetical protein
MTTVLIEKSMLLLLVLYLSIPITLTTSTQIPFIENVTLTTQFLSNNVQLINGTCDECLCISLFNYSALNCFPNNTCQLFPTFPLNYHIEVISGARLYFPQQVLPNVSQCMPNITYLLNKLETGNLISKGVTTPRDAVIDDHGYLVTVEWNTQLFDRFDPTTLNIISQTSLQYSQPTTVTYFNGSYYIAPYFNPMTVLDSENLSVSAYISTSTYGIRAIIFLNDGQMMVVSSFDTNSLVFLNRTSLVPIAYGPFLNQSTSFSYPHAMWRVNDSFFYVTSYYSQSLYSFSATNNSSQWSQNFVFSVSNGIGSGGAAHVTIDESGRFWFAYETDTILIFDQEGIQLGSWTIPNSQIFDIKIMDNYLIYLSSSKTNQIIRVDPNVQC